MGGVFKKNRVVVPVVLALLFGLFGGLLFLRHKQNQRDHRLINVPLKSVTGLRVSRGEVLVDVKREGDSFVFVTPFPGVSVDSRAINNFLSVLERIPVRRRWPEPENVSDYGIDSASARLVLMVNDQEQVFELGTKNPIDQEVYVHIPHEKQIVLIPGASAAVFQVQGLDFRNRRLLSTEGVVVGWDMWRPKRSILRAEKRGDDWYSSEGESAFYPCDRQQSQGVGEHLGGLRLSDFESFDKKHTLKEVGLSAPAARLTVHFSSGPAVELAFSSAVGPGPIAVAVNGELRGGVPREFIDFWPRDRTNLQKTKVVDFSLSAISRFSSKRDDMTAVYEKQRGKWYRLGREKRLIDSRDVNKFLFTLGKIKIDGFHFDEEFGAVSRQYEFYDGNGNVLMNFQLGTTDKGLTRATFEGVPYQFDILSVDVENLSL